MAEITHHKARALLQVAADQSLAPADKAELEAHLSVCKECRSYADHLSGVETLLRKAMHAKWDQYRPELNLDAIQNPSSAKLNWKNYFSRTQALGKVSILALLLLGYIAIVHFVGIRVPILNDETPTVLPTPNGFPSTSTTSPTPSDRSALTNLTSQACKTVIYIVQQGDTLESIAVQYGISKDTILEFNQKEGSQVATAVFTGMELVIPLCESTPVRTASLPGNALTITPINETIFPDQPQ